jgi:peptidoglycan hydrolase CwlO-like protein
MAIEIYSGAGTLLQTIPRVLTASKCEKLDGTLTFDFTVLQKGAQAILPGMVAKQGNQYYSIARVKRGFTGGMESCSASCEHISYMLNNIEYNLVTFVFEGYPIAGLTQLLAGTPFTVGVVEPTAMVECAFTDKSPLSRRSALMRFANACGSELEYDGYSINLRTHRGSTVRKTLMDGKNVTSLSATFDSRKDTQAYEVKLYKLVELSVGDEVNITYRPLSINVNTRIVALTYNPFDRYTVRVEVGSYVPNLLAAQTERIEGIVQTFTAANGRLESRIVNAEGAVSEIQQTVSGISTRVQDAEGNISTLSQTVGGFNARIEDAEGAVASMQLTVSGFNVRLTDAEGNMSALSQTVGGFSTRISDVEGNVSTLSQTVNGFSTCISNAEGDISSIEQSLSGITTRVSTSEGKISTITQNVSSITTRVSNAENDISTVEQTANKISWVVASGTSSSNFTLSSRVISLVSTGINITGYVTINALKTAGQTIINGGNITTGSISAARISSGTLTSMTISNTNIKIDGSYITFLNSNGAIKRGGGSSLENVLSFSSQAMTIGSYSGSLVNTLSIPMRTITIGYSTSYSTLTFSANVTNSGTLKVVGSVGFYGTTPSAKVTVAVASTSATLSTTITKLNEVINRLKKIGLA